MSVRTTSGPASADAILEAARRAIAERGSGKLRLSAVAAEAGVSRQTLYRWFPTKEDLLAALTGSEVELFDLGLRAEIEAHRSPARRLDAALRYLVTYLDGTMGAEAIGADPAFSLRSLGRLLSPHAESLARLLGEAMRTVPAVRAGTLTPEQAAELFLRVAYSHYLFPHPKPEALLSAMRALVGLGPTSARRARTA